MKSWPTELQMLAVLGATRALVAQSPHEGFSDDQPSECTSVLDQMIASILTPDSSVPPVSGEIQFLPTGPIQEIAISNGWQDAYSKLAAEFDRLQAKLNLYRAEDA